MDAFALFLEEDHCLMAQEVSGQRRSMNSTSAVLKNPNPQQRQFPDQTMNTSHLTSVFTTSGTGNHSVKHQSF
jgi:hypothetical protein